MILSSVCPTGIVPGESDSHEAFVVGVTATSVLTVVVFVPPTASMEMDADDTDVVGAFWYTFMPVLPMLTYPVRDDLVLFALTVIATSEVPIPIFSGDTLIQVSSDDVCKAHSLETDTFFVSPLAAMVKDEGVTFMSAGFCVNEYVISRLP